MRNYHENPVRAKNVYFVHNTTDVMIISDNNRIELEKINNVRKSGYKKKEK